MGADDQDLEQRLRTALQRKADQLDHRDQLGGTTLVDVSDPLPEPGYRSWGLVVALVGMAAVLIIGVIVARTGSESDDTGSADTVPVSTDAPLPAWLPAGMDVWGVSTRDETQTAVVVLGETGTDRTIEISVRDDERAAALDLSGAFPSGNRLEPYWPDSYTIAWGEVGRTYRALGRGLEPAEISDLVHQTTLRSDGAGYTAATVPDGWTLVETRLEPPAVATTARFAAGAPDAATPDLVVTQTVAVGEGDGAGWTTAAMYAQPEADGSIWTVPGDIDDSSMISMVGRQGQAVSVRSIGPDRLPSDRLRELVEEIVRGPSDQLTSLQQRSDANIARTPIVASGATDDGVVVQAHGSEDGGIAAVCVQREATMVCPAESYAYPDVDRVAGPDKPPGPGAELGGGVVAVSFVDDGVAVVYGASREEPTFADRELRSPAWVAPIDGWYLFRAVLSSGEVMVTLGGRGGATILVPDYY